MSSAAAAKKDKQRDSSPDKTATPVLDLGRRFRYHGAELTENIALHAFTLLPWYFRGEYQYTKYTLALAATVTCEDRVAAEKLQDQLRSDDEDLELWFGERCLVRQLRRSNTDCPVETQIVFVTPLSEGQGKRGGRKYQVYFQAVGAYYDPAMDQPGIVGKQEPAAASPAKAKVKKESAPKAAVAVAPEQQPEAGPATDTLTSTEPGMPPTTEAISPEDLAEDEGADAAV